MGIYLWHSVFHLSLFLVVDCVVWCVAGAYYSVRYHGYVSPCMYVGSYLPVTYLTMSVCLFVCVVCAVWLVSLGIVVGMDVVWRYSG